MPKLSAIVREADGAGLYAMAGPAFEPDCCIALPGASIAVMGPEAAINAVFFNQIQAIDDEAEREEFVRAQREEYAADIDILHLASEMVIDAVIEPDDLRAEVTRRSRWPRAATAGCPSGATRSRRLERTGARTPRFGPVTGAGWPIRLAK